MTLPNKTAAQVTDLQGKLRDGDPSIWVYAQGNSLAINCLLLANGEEQTIADRIKGLL